MKRIKSLVIFFLVVISFFIHANEYVCFAYFRIPMRFCINQRELPQYLSNQDLVIGDANTCAGATSYMIVSNPTGQTEIPMYQCRKFNCTPEDRQICASSGRF